MGFGDWLFRKKRLRKLEAKAAGKTYEERNELRKRIQQLCMHEKIGQVRDTEPDIMGNMFSYRHCERCGKIMA